MEPDRAALGFGERFTTELERATDAQRQAGVLCHGEHCRLLCLLFITLTNSPPDPAANAGAGGSGAGALPAGVEMVDGRAIVKQDTPTFDVLAAATRANKEGKRGGRQLPHLLKARQGTQEAGVGVEALWAALRCAGGLHTVSLACTAVLHRLHV